MAKPILVIDWDGTLGFSELVSIDPTLEDRVSNSPEIITIDRNGVREETYLFIRPYVRDFLAQVGKYYRLILWSYGVGEYIRQCMDSTGLRIFFSDTFVREDMRAPIKDLLDFIEQDLTNIAIIDDSNRTFGILNPYNCIDIPAWRPSMTYDTVLQVMPRKVDFHFQYILAKHSAQELRSLRTDAINRLKVIMRR